MSDKERTSGTVTRYISHRGFGFAMGHDHNEEVFFHYSAFPKDVMPIEGQDISFEQGTDRQGRSMACHIKILSEQKTNNEVSNDIQI